MVDINVELINFLEKYFFSGYTIFNTLVYGLILVVIIFLIIKLFKKINKNPEKLMFSIIPFIIFGSSIRALVDNGIFPYNWLLITPGIYFIVGISTILSLILGIYVERKKKIDFRYIIFIIGLILAIPILLQINQLNLIPIAEILLVWGIISSIFILIGKKWDLFKNKYNLSVISAHIFDASSTFIAVDYFGYYEQHVVPNLIYNEVGTAISIFPLKIIVITLALYTIDKYIDDKTIKGILKLSVFILGLAPGIRNFLTLSII
jgi:uncharacterized membrane protein